MSVDNSREAARIIRRDRFILDCLDRSGYPEERILEITGLTPERLTELRDSRVVRVTMRSCPRAYSNDVRSAASVMFAGGLGYKAVSSCMGIAASTVREWKRLWRLGLFEAEPKRHSLTQRQSRQAVDFYGKGLPLTAIACIMGCSTGPVLKALREAGADKTSLARKKQQQSENESEEKSGSRKGRTGKKA